MDLELLAILITGILNLLATLRQSRCTEIDSQCCCMKFHVNRELEDKHQEDKLQNQNTNELI